MRTPISTRKIYTINSQNVCKDCGSIIDESTGGISYWIDKKEYIKRRIKHCELRLKLHETETKGKESYYTYHAGRVAGFWAGLLEGYNQMIDIIEDEQN